MQHPLVYHIKHLIFAWALNVYCAQPVMKSLRFFFCFFLLISALEQASKINCLASNIWALSTQCNRTLHTEHTLYIYGNQWHVWIVSRHSSKNSRLKRYCRNAAQQQRTLLAKMIKSQCVFHNKRNQRMRKTLHFAANETADNMCWIRIQLDVSSAVPIFGVFDLYKVRPFRMLSSNRSNHKLLADFQLNW